MKKRELHLPPTSAGRVSGFGLNMKVRDYYSDAKSKKARKVTGVAKAEVEQLKKQVEDLQQVKEQLPNLVASQVNETIKALTRSRPHLFRARACPTQEAPRRPV